MARSNKEVSITIKGDTKDINQALKNLSKDSKRNFKVVKDSAKDTSKSMTADFGDAVRQIGILVGSIKGISTAIQEFESAARRASQSRAFENLAENAGTSAEELITQLKEVSNQTLSTQQIIETGARALVLGLQPDEIVRLLEIARASTKATGQTITEAFGDISLGVARQSKLILDNLGILLDYDSALKDLAASFEITTEQLDDSQRRQAFLNATFKAGNEILIKTGNITDDLSDKIAQQNALLDDNIIKAKDAIFQSDLWSKTLGIVNGFLERFIVEGKESTGILDILKDALGLGISAFDEYADNINDALDGQELLNRAAKKAIESTKEQTKEVAQQTVAVRELTEEEKKLVDSLEQIQSKRENLEKRITQLRKKQLDQQTKDLEEQQEEQIQIIESTQDKIQEILTGQRERRDVIESLGFDELSDADLNRVLIDRIRENLREGTKDSLTEAFEDATSLIARDSGALIGASAFDKQATLEEIDRALREIEVSEVASLKTQGELATETQQNIQSELDRIEKELETLEAQLSIETNIAEIQEEIDELTKTETKIIRIKTIQEGSGSSGSSESNGMQTGGRIPGTGRGDTVPIMAEPGEFMMRRSTVKALGSDFFDSLNRMDLSGAFEKLGSKKFQAGGLVSDNRDTVKVDLNLGGNTFTMNSSSDVAGNFVKQIKRTNVINSRKRNYY